MSNYDINGLNGIMPKQMIPESKKTKKWGQDCVEAVASFGRESRINGRSSSEQKQVNYDLVNSILDEDDFKYVLDPYNLGADKIGEQPAKLRSYNLIKNKINLLKGEEMARPFNYTVMALNGEAVSLKEEETKKLFQQLAYFKFKQLLGLPEADPIDPNTGQPIPQQFEQLEKYANDNIVDIREKWANAVLSYEEHNQKLLSKFNQGFEDVLTVGEEIYYIGITNGQVVTRRCNPINCEYDRSPDDNPIEDGDWFREDRWMTSNQIIDEFGGDLKDSEIELIERGLATYPRENQMFPGYAYPEKDFKNGNQFSIHDSSNGSHYLVTHVVWKALKKIGFVNFQDETGEMIEMIVDEYFKLSDEQIAAGYTLEWRWIPEVWEGDRIGTDIYANVRRVPNQIRYMENPSKVKLPYVGRVFNSVNTSQTSFVDLLKPYQYFYDILWFRTEAEVAKSKGKKLLMDMAMIPKSRGMTLDRWMYHFDNLNVAWINSFEEGTGSQAGKTSNFNQFRDFDLSVSQSVSQYIGLMQKIEQQIDSISGINPQREGSTFASETAHGTERAVTQSSHITEPWFYVHNEVKIQVLTHILEATKYAYEGTKKITYITDDAHKVFLNIDVDKFADSDYGMFVTNSVRDLAVLKKLEFHADQAISSGALQFTDLVEIFRNKSVASLSSNLKKSEQERAAREQEQQKVQQEMQQQALEAQQQAEEAKRQHEAEQNELDRQNKIDVAVINAMGFDDDTQGNDRIDVIEQGKAAIERQKLAQEQMDKASQRMHEAGENEKDRQLKRDEIQSKEKIENLKARTALKNKVSGEK